MKKSLLSFVFGVILLLVFINFICAVEICVDHDIPSEPSSLSVTSSGNDLILTWDASTDKPDCSGIDYYIVSRDGVNLGNPTSLTYTDTNVSYGTYNYTVFAMDKAGHNSGPAIKIEIKAEPSSKGGTHHGGGGGGNTIIIGGEPENSYVCDENWQCGDWTNCTDGEQTRTCIDTNACGTINNKPSITQDCKEETISSTNFFTGAVTGVTDFATSPTGIGLIIGSLVLIGGIVALNVRKKSVKKTEDSKEGNQDLSDKE